MRFALLAAVAATLAAPAFADQTTGTVESYTAATHELILADNTVWTLPADLALPEGFGIGDAITIDFTSAGENGIGKVQAIRFAAVMK